MNQRSLRERLRQKQEQKAQQRQKKAKRHRQERSIFAGVHFGRCASAFLRGMQCVGNSAGKILLLFLRIGPKFVSYIELALQQYAPLCGAIHLCAILIQEKKP